MCPPAPFLWSVICSAYRWAAASAASAASVFSHSSPLPPKYSADLRFGLLVPSLAHPTAAYLARLPSPSLIALNHHSTVFSVTGSRQEILDCLRSEDHFPPHAMVHCSVPNATSHNATSHLLIEIYRWPSSPASTSTSISSIFDYLFSPRRLLVVRPAPSLAPPSCPATPLLRVAAPHALTLLEIAHILEHAAFTGQHDLTRNKALNISLIGRSLPDSPPSPLSPADHLVHCAHTTSSPDQLPPYQPCIGGLPPAYSPHPLPPLFI